MRGEPPVESVAIHARETLAQLRSRQDVLERGRTLLATTLRNDARLVLPRGIRGIGLSACEDGPRVLTRSGYVERLAASAGGELPVTDVLAYLKEKYETTVRRALLGTKLNGAVLRVDKDVVRRVDGVNDGLQDT